MPKMKAYHRTFHSAEILREGFRDTTGTYLTDREFAGVWVSDLPLECNEEANGDLLLVLDIPEEIFREYEWVEEGRLYREALVPAEILNSLPPPRITEG